MRILTLALCAGAIAVSCGKASTPAALKDQFSGAEFLYLDQNDRSAVVGDLRNMTIDNYALLSIKAARGIVPDAKKMFDDAIAKEAQIENIGDADVLGQARSNLLFLDRIRVVIANFQDSHFSSSPMVARPTILNGLEVRRVDGDIRVATKRSQILEFDGSHAIDPAAYKSIAIGMKVISIDGVPALKAAEALLPFISASTPSSRDMWAAAALSQRSFSYPEKSYADWEFATDNGQTLKVRLPFFYSNTVTRKDALFFLKAKGFQPLNDLRLNWSEKDRGWAYNRAITVEGFVPQGAPAGLVGEQVWSGVSSENTVGGPTFRTGYLMKAGKVYGVLQVFEFSSQKVTQSNAEAAVAFDQPVVNFVKSLKQAETPLIIDLRTNGGGDPMNSIAILAAIAKKDGVYPSTNRALRVTRVIRQMLELEDAGKLPDLNKFNYDATSLQELRAAVAERREYTTAFTLTDDVKANPAVGGYEQKIVALITPMCISACDGMALLLKASKRATLIGTMTNGTGAGFIGNDQFDGSHFRDRLQLVSLRIPNRLFGPGGETGRRVFNDPDAYIKYNSENQPPVADVNYIESAGDIQSSSVKWFDKALEVLNTAAIE